MTQFVHRLVALAFLDGAAPGTEVLHGDGDPSNNVPSNLRWGSSAENKLDVVRHGKHVQASKTHCPLGHPLAHPNLDMSKLRRGVRGCRACLLGRKTAAVKRGERSLKVVADEKCTTIMGPNCNSAIRADEEVTR